ncbi:MAG: tRNA glutamyl-Q(34) synthetase GluQRS [Pseudomonadota bacterium]
MYLRFAPSPNGRLHLGHAFSALENARIADELGATLLLRMEDIDTARCTPKFERAILDELAWLGVTWTPPLQRQSERFGAYREAIESLQRMGVIYPCFATRADIASAIDAQPGGGTAWPRDPDGAPIYPGLHKGMPEDEAAARIAAGEPHNLRLDMAAALRRVGCDRVSWSESGAGPDSETGIIQASPAIWGDAVLIRKDTPASYHLSCVVDDGFQEITDIVRGHDLFHATALHRLLQTLLDLPEPRYHHHRLIPDQDGRKLSKSSGSTGLAELRAAGKTAQDVRAILGY